MASTDDRQAWNRLLAQPLIRQIARAAGAASWHLVGGILRDALLDRPASDVDLVVNTGGRSLATRISAELGGRLVRLGGHRFAAYRIVAPGSQIDVWDREGGSLEDDLARRDFTIHAMALEPTAAVLLDPHDGRADLAARRLRATRLSTFSEDPLRVLRVARFAAALDFAVEPSTLDLARDQAGGLRSVAIERVREELGPTLSGPRAPHAVEMLIALAVFPGLWRGEPGLGAAPQETAAQVANALSRLEELRGLGVGSSAFDRHALVHAVLFAAARRGREELAELVEAAKRSGLLSGSEARTIGHLLRPLALPETERSRRWFLHLAGDPWPGVLSLQGRQSRQAPAEWTDLAGRLAELARAEGESIFRPKPLLDGREVGSLLGLPAGPRLGEFVASLRRAQVEGTIENREGAARFLEALRRPSTSG